MTQINSSQIDNSRTPDPSTVVASQSRTTTVSSEMQQNFERLMQAKARDQSKESLDSQSQLVGRSFASQPALEDEQLISEMLNEGHTQTNQPDMDAIDNQALESFVGAPTDQVFTEAESEDACVTSMHFDSSSAKLTTEEADRNESTLESSTNAAGLPSPLDLFSRTTSSPIVAAISTERASPPVDTRLIDLARQVADRILISDAANGPREVNIQIKDSILPGTEIRLSEQAGQLQVNMVTDQKSSLDFLLQQQSALNVQLEQRLSRDVVVSVDLDSLRQFSSDQQSDSYSEKQNPERGSTSDDESDLD